MVVIISAIHLHSFEDHIFLIVEQSISMCNTLNYEIRVTMIVIIQLCYNPFGLFCLYSLLVTKPLLCGTCLFSVGKLRLETSVLRIARRSK